MSVSITNVLLLDNVDPSAERILKENGINANLCKEKFTPAELIKKLQDFDGVVVRSATKVTAEIIEQCPKLKIVGRAGVGVDNVDIKTATKHGVVVMNTPGGNTLSAAEHTCALICCLSRNIPAADASMKAEKWDRKAFMGHELYGKTLGIIGLGRIGREAAIRMQSFGMKTIGFDPLVSKEEAEKYNIDWMTVEEIWPKADYITVHTPLIPQTKVIEETNIWTPRNENQNKHIIHSLLNDNSFKKCKKGVRVINCARGGIIDEDALLRALESGQCGGAGLDVYVEEPATNFPLVKHPKVVACPHLGASTKEGQARCGKEIAEQFADVKSGKSFFGVLNAPALTQSSGVENWVPTMSSMGRILKGFFSAPLSQINIESNGKELARAGNCLKAAVCAGYLKSTSEDVNLINAAAMAAERNINVDFTNCDQAVDGFTATCSLKAQSETNSVRLTSAIEGDKSLLVGLDSQVLSLPMPITGNMFFAKCGSTDVSAVIGELLALGINVMSFSSSPVVDGALWVVFALSKTVAVERISSAKLQCAACVTL